MEIMKKIKTSIGGRSSLCVKIILTNEMIYLCLIRKTHKGVLDRKACLKIGTQAYLFQSLKQ